MLLKKILFVFLFNSTLFTTLIVGIQNSSSSKDVDLIFGKTVQLPISFIIGLSFISGSITGSFININHK